MILAESLIEDRYRLIVERKKAENEDRIRFQLDSIDRYRKRRDSVLAGVQSRHELYGRIALAAATQGKRAVIARNSELRRAAVMERQKVRYSSRLVCCGVINFL